MKLKENWRRKWNFETKMYFVIVMAIIITTLLGIIVSTVSSVYSLTKQSRQHAMEQLAIMANDYENNLDQYKSLATSVVLDEYVQKYCNSLKADETYEVSGQVYGVLMNLLNIQNNANFLAITNENAGTYVYNGNFNIHESDFEIFSKDYEKSILAKSKGTLRISFSNTFYKGKKNTITLYFPVYSLTHMITSNGMVIINLDDNIIERLNSQNKIDHSNLYLTNMEGHIISTYNKESIGETIEFKDKLKEKSGTFWHNGKLINYKKIDDWNLYLTHEISPIYFLQNCINTTIILLLGMLIVLGVALLVSKNIINKLYRPLNKILNKMNDVSNGRLKTRISTNDMDSDSMILAVGFNSMMDRIDVLIQQVKEEQLQLNQVKLNALQSQIQPHFLYNTLECVHWQALSEGSQEISTIVKALAKYYRICLSEGHDIITLDQELEHVRNYMIIQNMRYENIIDLNIQVDDQYKKIKIPKLTLQPLVENSIYHGFRAKEGIRGRIDIYMEDTEEGNYLVVADDGVGMTKEQIRHFNNSISEFDRNIGYGINNVNKRIELMFGGDYGLKFRSNYGKGFLVEIHLPREE